jgi:uncharacterized protein
VNATLAASPERFVVFDCAGAQCVGLLSGAPGTAPPGATGVVIIVGGPQYRVGSHRQFVLLARALAGEGIPTLRFDYRGMGDSEGEPRGFDTIGQDIAAAVDTLCRETGVSRIVLWGLCDGASAAFMYAGTDARVAGIVALNPWARSIQGESSARLKHYYVRRICSPGFWKKVLSGRFDPRTAAGDLATTMRNATDRTAVAASAPFLQRMEEGWRQFRRPVLILLSGRDLTAREFESWAAAARGRRSLLRDVRTEVVAFPTADHTFSDRRSRDAVAAKTLEWLSRAIANG